jgi:hypothetical protein
MRSALLDLGYNADNADKLLAFAKKDRHDHLLANKWVKLYARNGIDKDTLRTLLTDLGYGPDEIDSAVEEETREIHAANRSKCVDAVGSKFKAGIYDEATVQRYFAELGLDSDQADRMLSLWRCQEKVVEREPAAAQLCDWYSKGLISVADFGERLLNLGYSQNDMTLMITRCNVKVSEAQAKELIKQEKELEAQIAKQVAAEEKALKQAEQLAKQKQAAADKAERLRVDRLNKLTKLVQTLAARDKIPETGAATMVAASLGGLISFRDIPVDDAYAIILDAGNDLGKRPDDSWSDIVDSVRESYDLLDIGS